jgi:hypothetical protein
MYMRSISAALLITASASAAQQTGSAVAAVGMLDDLQLLVGKRVVVGRMPLCVPKTYTANLTYAGKPATVISFVRNPALEHTNLNRTPAGLRPMMADAKKGGNLLFRFADGTELDACGSLMFSQLSANIELAPGETITGPAVVANGLGATPAVGAAAPGAVAPVQQCPIVITKVSSGVSVGHALVDALTTSELQRQVDQTIHGGQPKHYVDMRVRNTTEKPVVAFEFSAVYSNKMGDETTSATYVSQNPHAIKPGEDSKFSAMDRDERSQNGAGDLKLYVSRVRFTDGTFWDDNGSRSCSRALSSNS